jgi:hypothetical protein
MFFALLIEQFRYQFLTKLPSIGSLTSLGSARQARPQERRNGVDDSLEPSSLLAEFFESLAQFVAFRVLGELNHVRSLHGC